MYPPTRFIRRNQRAHISTCVEELFENAHAVINAAFRIRHLCWRESLDHLKSSTTRFKAHLAPIEEAIEHAIELIDSPEDLMHIASSIRQVVLYSRTLRNITTVIGSSIHNPLHRELMLDALRKTADVMLNVY